MIVSVDECKVLLGITDNTYDESFRILIPYVQRDVADYCNNAFADTVIYKYSHGGIAFARGTTTTGTTDPDTITDDEDEFTTAGFRAGMDIVVLGGSNEGYHQLAVVSTDTLTLTSTGEVEDQDGSTNYRDPGPILIARANWPKPVRSAAAQMVWHLTKHARRDDIKSESIDDYSVTFAGEHEYPKHVMQRLDKYRNVIMA